MSDAIQVFEVGPRDGLQNEKTVLSTENKIWLIESLVAAGLKRLEVGAMVRADRVPQMADSDELAKGLRSHGVAGDHFYLVPNSKGLDRAIQAGVKNIAVFTAVSETFNQKNIGMSVSHSLDEIRTIVSAANGAGINVRGYVSTAWGCPFEGRVSTKSSLKVIDALLSLSMECVSIGDTIGVASAKGVRDLVHPILSHSDTSRIAVHFHDTRGSALANAFQSFELGVRIFDASIGGLGGCPFAPGASGNLATEDLVYFFKEMGVSTGVDYSQLCEASLSLHQKMGKGILASKALQAYQANCTKNTVWDRS